MKENKQCPEVEFYADTMEQEEKKKEFSFLNRDKGILVNEFEKGLNREQGVFDQTAVFRTL